MVELGVLSARKMFLVAALALLVASGNPVSQARSENGTPIASVVVSPDDRQDAAVRSAPVVAEAKDLLNEQDPVEIERIGWGSYLVHGHPCLNVRSQAALDARVLRCQPAHTVLMSDGRRAEAGGISWIHVELTGTRTWGWAAEKYLALEGNCGSGH